MVHTLSMVCLLREMSQGERMKAYTERVFEIMRDRMSWPMWTTVATS